MNIVGLITNAGCILCGFCREIQIHQEDIFGCQVNSIDIFNLFDREASDIDYVYASRIAGEDAAGVRDRNYNQVEPYMRMAARLLTEAQFSIAKIATQVGYASELDGNNRSYSSLTTA